MSGLRCSNFALAARCSLNPLIWPKGGDDVQRSYCAPVASPLDRIIPIARRNYCN